MSEIALKVLTSFRSLPRATKVLSIVVLTLATVTAAPNPGPATSLTKRWCGFEIDCSCEYNPKIGCVPILDPCELQWYWPPSCKKCGDCSEVCLDPIVCASS
ncbi:hypothetical protein C8F04DRAFT_1127430 [Mycena alexandri]|uniref:Uncharacterized protein n=1 Tax=Mycena alexandri TaxID=1745969 RepID=A0AAD6WWB0_9AGAR|nr:hypothetical protein C8F04DRAFT_1127430 [Mycena alexandri]